MKREPEEKWIIIKLEGFVDLTLKIALLLAVVFFPILILYLTQDTFHILFGEPNPMAPAYLTIIALLIVWYGFGFAVVLPRGGRFIDRLIETKFRKDKDVNDPD